MNNKEFKDEIIKILYDNSNPMGYQLCGEDSFEHVADEIIKVINNKSNDDCKIFIPATNLTTATICKTCGREKWEH